MSTSLLRHIVLLSFKGTATPADIQTVERAFCELPVKVAEIKAFEWGTDVSVENLAKGFTHCFTLTFASAADRDIYLPHPAHQAFAELAGPHVADVLVIDYWAKPA